MWTDWSVPSPLRCRRCRCPSGLSEDAHLPPHFPTQLALSPLASQLSRVCTGTWPGMVSLPSENLPLSIGLFSKWPPIGICWLPIGTIPIFTASSFFQPKSFCDIWDLSDSLSFRVALSFQWTPITLDFPKMNWRTRMPKRSNTPLYPCFQGTGHGYC